MPITIICSVCGKPFQKPPSVKSTYCSRECYQAGLERGDSRKGVYITCVICGEPFYVMPSRAETAKYCSYECHQIGEGRKGGAIRGEQLKALSTGKSYPKQNGRHIHRTKAEQKIGRKLSGKDTVHHKDGNIHNSEPDNLVVITQSEHITKHIKYMLQRRKEIHGY